MSTFADNRRSSNAALVNRLKNNKANPDRRSTALFDDDLPVPEEAPPITIEVPTAPPHTDAPNSYSNLKAFLRKRPHSAFGRRQSRENTNEQTNGDNIEDEEPILAPVMPQRVTLHGSRLSRYYVPNSIAFGNEKDEAVCYLGVLPDEVLIEVLSFIEPKDMARCQMVCRRWNAVSLDESLWQRFALKYYPEETRKEKSENNNLGVNTSSPLTRKRYSQDAVSKTSSFYRTTFLKHYKLDLSYTKTGLWRNDRITKNIRRNQRLAREDYELVHEQMRNNTSGRRDSMPVKVVVVGDGAVGKTSLLCRFANNYFPEQEFLPTIFDNFSIQTIYNNVNYNVSLWDTAGPEDFDKLRPLSYNGTDVFLLCIDLAYADSLRNGGQRWVQELSRCAPGVPIMLCGTKLDLRVDKTSKKSKQFAPITFDSATEIARSIGAVAYSETSALTGAGVEKAFEEVIRIGCMNALLQRTASTDKKCGLM